MKYRKVGASGLKVSEIGLGTWKTFGGYINTSDAKSIILKAYDLGINLIDTANVYHNGEAESIIGSTISELSRESLVLSSKVFWPMGEGPNDLGLSRKHIMHQIEQSLSRLRTEYIDIYYCHRYDKDTPLEETLRAMDDLVRQGKVLYIGVSAWTAEEIESAVNIADKFLLDRIIVNQPKYNLLNREIENKIVPKCLDLGLGQIIYSPLAQGLLTGKYSNIEEGSNNRFQNKSIIDLLDANELELYMEIKNLCHRYNTNMTQLSLNWILQKDFISSVLIGASSVDQLEKNIKSIYEPVSQSLLNELSDILRRVCIN